MDKLLQQAEIRCYQPYKGLLTVRLKELCEVKVRVPDFVDPAQIKIKSNKGNIKLNMWRNYIELGQRQVGETLKISYPIPILIEEVSIGNPGFRHYRYRVIWKGDTVVRIEPLGKNYKTGYSDFEKKRVPIFYGANGPGPLYLRNYILGDIKPVLSPIHFDDGSLDLWHIKNKRSTG
jgi:hypothetical protein